MGLWAAAPGCRSTVAAALPGSRRRSWPPPADRAVRACGDVVRAGWLAWRGLGGRRAGRAEITGSREGAKPRSPGIVDQYMNQGGHFALSGDGRQQHGGLLCGRARLLQLRPVEAEAVVKSLRRIGLSSSTAEKQPPHQEASRWQEHSNSRASWRRARQGNSDGDNERCEDEQERVS